MRARKLRAFVCQLVFWSAYKFVCMYAVVCEYICLRVRLSVCGFVCIHASCMNVCVYFC